MTEWIHLPKLMLEHKLENPMHSDQQIRETFAHMGLLSEQERRHFRSMVVVQPPAGHEQTCFFIRTSGGAHDMRGETQDAELESDSE